MRLTLGDMLGATAQSLPDKTAFIYKDKRMTYRQLEERSNRLANGLLARGYNPGDHIAVLAYNGIEYPEILFGVGKAGMVLVLVNFRLVGPEMTYILEQSDSKCLIYQSDFKETIHPIRRGLKSIGKSDTIVFGGSGDPDDLLYENLLANSNSGEPPIEVDESSPLYIAYTSGTTGRPKGAMRTHRASVLHPMKFTHLFREKNVNLMIAPLFHLYSLFLTFSSVFYGGTTYIYPSGDFDAREILEIMEREKITFAAMIPTLLTMILAVEDRDRYDLSSVDSLFCSASPLLTQTKNEILGFFKNVKLYESYGATETGSVTLLQPQDMFRTVRSCGKALPFTRVKILNAEGQECKPGEPGELYANTAEQFTGYYKQPEATEKAFRGEYVGVGDIAMVDEEGFYYIIDRKNDMIISGGENVYPAEVDEVLSKHPKVQQVAVIGVPDKKWGEAVKAVIVPRPGADTSEAEIIAYAKENLAGYKCPKSVDFWETLPLSPTGKILKREIRAKYWEDQKSNL